MRAKHLLSNVGFECYSSFDFKCLSCGRKDDAVTLYYKADKCCSTGFKNGKYLGNLTDFVRYSFAYCSWDLEHYHESIMRIVTSPFIDINVKIWVHDGIPFFTLIYYYLT